MCLVLFTHSLMNVGNYRIKNFKKSWYLILVLNVERTNISKRERKFFSLRKWLCLLSTYSSHLSFPLKSLNFAQLMSQGKLIPSSLSSTLTHLKWDLIGLKAANSSCLYLVQKWARDSYLASNSWEKSGKGLLGKKSCMKGRSLFISEYIQV